MACHTRVQQRTDQRVLCFVRVCVRARLRLSRVSLVSRILAHTSSHNHKQKTTKQQKASERPMCTCASHLPEQHTMHVCQLFLPNIDLCSPPSRLPLPKAIARTLRRVARSLHSRQDRRVGQPDPRAHGVGHRGDCGGERAL
eukprot:2143182-Rhodomonas_salina.3